MEAFSKDRRSQSASGKARMSKTRSALSYAQSMGQCQQAFKISEAGGPENRYDTSGAHRN